MAPRLGLIFSSLFMTILIMVTWSCETREPGCLEPMAMNFDFEAIEECDSCCILPSALLNIAYVFDTFDFSFNDTIILPDLDSLTINSIQLPFSEFSFKSVSEDLELIDTIRNEVPQVRDNYIILSSADRIEAIGQSNFITEIIEYSCRLGLEPNLTLGLKPFEDISDDSKFINVIEDMYVDSTSTLVQARMTLTVADSTRMLELTDISNPNINVRDTVNIELGRNWTLGMTMDMSILIEGLHADQSNELMEATISQNISRAIRPE